MAVDHPIGDHDENIALSNLRPVSDALIFRKKNK